MLTASIIKVVYLQEIEKRAKKFQGEASARSTANFTQWIEEALNKGAGPAHKWSNKQVAFEAPADYGKLLSKVCRSGTSIGINAGIGI